MFVVLESKIQMSKRIINFGMKTWQMKIFSFSKWFFHQENNFQKFKIFSLNFTIISFGP